MSTKRVLLVILVASAVVLAVEVGSRVAGGAYALPSAQEPDPAGVTVPYPGRLADEAGLPGQGLNVASASGGPIGDNFPISNLSEDQVYPAVAYNSQREEYLVVWYNDRPGNDDIYGQRVSKNGTLVGPWFAISAGAGADRRYPDVAYNSKRNEYLVVWETDWHVQAQRVPALGGTVGSKWTIASGTVGVDYYDQPAVAYAYTADRYVVAFRRVDLLWVGGGSDIYFDVREWDLAPVVQNPVAAVSAATLPQNPDLAYNRTRNELLVVWQQWMPGPPASFDIYGRRMTMAGTLPHVLDTSIPIQIDGKDQIVPAVAAIPTESNKGHYLVVWEHRHSATDGDIHARRVEGDGTLNPGFIVSEAPENQTNPAVAGSEAGQQHLVAWTQDYTSGMVVFPGIGVRTVSSNGDLGTETRLGGWNADHAAVASGPLGDFLVALDDLVAITGWNIYGWLWGNRVYLPLVVRNFQ